LQTRQLRSPEDIGKPPAPEIPECIVHPVLVVPPGNIVYDVHSLEDYLHFVKLLPAHGSNAITSTQVVPVFERLVEPDVDGVVRLIPDKLIGVPFHARTGSDPDCPLERIRPQGRCLALPKLNNFDIIDFRFDLKIRRYLWDSVRSQVARFKILYSPTIQTVHRTRMGEYEVGVHRFPVAQAHGIR
jgi:hypothetical protein